MVFFARDEVAGDGEYGVAVSVGESVEFGCAFVDGHFVAFAVGDGYYIVYSVGVDSVVKTEFERRCCIVYRAAVSRELVDDFEAVSVFGSESESQGLFHLRVAISAVSGLG